MGKVQPSVTAKRKPLDTIKVLDDKLSVKKDVVPGSKVSSKPTLKPAYLSSRKPLSPKPTIDKIQILEQR